jgi:hypothetical protein
MLSVRPTSDRRNESIHQSYKMRKRKQGTNTTMTTAQRITRHPIMQPQQWVCALLVVISVLSSSSLAWIASSDVARPLRRNRLENTVVALGIGADGASAQQQQQQQEQPRQSQVPNDTGSSAPFTPRLLEPMLREHGYSSRLLTIYDSELPLLAEAYINGKSVIGQVSSFQRSSASSGNYEQEPKVRFDLLSEQKTQVLDLGQITNIWHVGNVETELMLDLDECSDKWIPISKFEQDLDSLYKSRVGRARSETSGLTKKQVSKLTSEFENPQEQQHADTVLRKVLKAGSGLVRLVDSSTVGAVIYSESEQDANADKTLQFQAIAAHVLSNDAAMGGRFKRFPCLWVATATQDNTGGAEDSDCATTLINGGWLVVDQSVRAGTEARKFVERPPTAGLKTEADERIARRLECLAMGEVFASNDDRGSQRNDDRDLQLDVREVLTGMKLPLSPKGATEALIRIGRWSGKENFSGIQPWPKDVLEASAWYAEMDRLRSISGELEPGRVDLTMYPCVSVDAKRTTFRDDALGVRPRASTGRKVDAAASKWEILIHITDVSDIYSPNSLVEDPSDYLALLRKAAESRGTSRYDLPLGPLHLLPPVALKALSLSDMKEISNRCVTLWVYIDERNGRILDCGLERTQISSPIKLTFAKAVMYMEDESMETDLDARGTKARAILQVAERNLNLWSIARRENSEFARKREARLSAREDEARGDVTGDDGRNGFVRTRGHLLVDSALDLYAYGTARLLQVMKAPVPRTAGADASRGGRVATAPLRRYIDGVAQRQALAVLCKYGGSPLSLEECVEAGKAATEAKNSITNISAMRPRD